MSEDAIVGKARGAAELAEIVAPGRPPTPEQERVVEAGMGPVLVVAGAGSGKTETLSLRMAYLLDHALDLWGEPVAPEQILCLTFTRKAAAELDRRTRRFLDDVYGEDQARPAPTIATYNAYADGLVREHGLRVGADPEAVVLTDAGLWQLASRVVEEWSGDLETNARPSSLARGVPRLAAALTDHDVTPEDVVRLATEIAEAIDAIPGRDGQPTKGALEAAAAFRSRAAAARLVEEFQRRKREGGYLDFADQVAIARKLARVPAVRTTESSRYRVVLLDEFQDTSIGQLDLFSDMFGEDHPVMAVGDPHQAIYGFRGASGDSLAAFVERFGGTRSVERLTLSTSWRNDAGVLDVANAVTAPLRESPTVEVPLLRSRGATLDRPEPSRPVPAVTAHVYADTAAEVEAVVDELLSRRASLAGEVAEDDVVSSAILCRRRSQFAAFATALRARGVAYQVVGLGGLLETPEIVDLVALLEVAHDPSRGDSLMRLLSSDRIALGARDLAALGEWAEELAGPRDERESEASIVDALASPPPDGWASAEGRPLGAVARTRLADLRTAVAAVRAHTYLPLPELVAVAWRLWGLDIECALGRPPHAASRELDAFAQVARSFSTAAERPTLGGFLAWLDAARTEESGLDSPVEEPDPEAVQIQTIHSAKGLEFHVVAIPGMVNGAFPNFGGTVVAGARFRDSGWLGGVDLLPWPLRRDAASLPRFAWEGVGSLADLKGRMDAFREAAGERTLDEERRLFYVALTRAFHSVVASGAWWGEGSKPLEPSVFLRELVEAGLASDAAWDARPGENPLADRPAPSAVWPPDPTPGQERRRAFAAEVREAIARGAPGSGLPFEREIDAMLAERDARTDGAARVVTPSHLSTTALVSLRRDAEGFALGLRRPLPQEPSAAAERGSAFHAWVEEYFGRHPLLDDDVGIDEDAGANLVALRDAFLASPWANRRPSDVEVDVEVPLGGVVVRSRIDAVFPPGGGLERVTVVDWKSGAPPRDDAEREAREVQLGVYRIAWAAWKGLEPEDVDAAFFYAATGETVTPERLMGEEEIAALLGSGS